MTAISKDVLQETFVVVVVVVDDDDDDDDTSLHT
jgi:hypothetical protein